ncbi:MAG: ABC transporter ATP-binding protein [Clostridiales bacterium]|nr:ABC transporter ATP-binding protein [Clostridiales bacterium]
MNLIFRYMKKQGRRIGVSMTLKTLGTLGELMIPYILEHIIDVVVPQGRESLVLLWGCCMVAAAVLVRTLNVTANRTAVFVGKECIRSLRYDLFQKTINLSGAQFDRFGLPSLTSRMTSDSYNVQDFMVSVQAMGIRSPMMLLGGIVVTMVMDPALSGILCIMVPILGVTVFCITRYGIPLYTKVQTSVDRVVQVLRENITGIRVVKALSKEDYERARFRQANEQLTDNDVRASITMATPGPIMQLALNTGLTLVVIVGGLPGEQRGHPARRDFGLPDLFQHDFTGGHGLKPHLYDRLQGHRFRRPYRPDFADRGRPAGAGGGGPDDGYRSPHRL